MWIKAVALHIQAKKKLDFKMGYRFVGQAFNTPWPAYREIRGKLTKKKCIRIFVWKLYNIFLITKHPKIVGNFNFFLIWNKLIEPYVKKIIELKDISFWWKSEVLGVAKFLEGQNSIIYLKQQFVLWLIIFGLTKKDE